MSPDSVAPFVPSALSRDRADVSRASQAAGYAAGWTAGAKAAAEAAHARAQAHESDHVRRESERDARVVRAVTALDQAAQQWRDRALPVLAEAQSHVLRAGVDLAEAILARELAAGPDTARDVVARALDVPGDVVPSTLRVSRVDHVEIMRLVDAGTVTLPPGVVIEADAGLAAGDVVTIHERGAIDATVAAALARARQALEEE